MRAIVRTKYGPPNVLRLEEVEKPVPNDNEVLVKIYSASVNALDWHLLEGKPFLARMGSGLLGPKQKILGADIAGRVEEVGRRVVQFHPGDEVFGGAHWGFAEYACAREDRLALKPTNVTFEESAAVPVAAITALQALRKGRVESGHKVLINGASGGVGTFAVQLAKSFGAEVTAVTSTKNMDSARSMGADHVIDYTREDFTKTRARYDLILGVNGYHSILGYRRALCPKGTYVFVGGSRLMTQFLQSTLLAPLISRIGGKKMSSMGVAKLNQEDLALLKGLLESGQIRPVIDGRYSLSETPEAIRYLEAGHARGKVVITVAQDN